MSSNDSTTSSATTGTAASNNNASGNTANVNQRAVYRPTKPKFGNVTQTGSETWTAWTGGKPLADWSGLEDDNPSMINPNQFRSSSVTSRAKSQYYRVQGMSTKLTRDSNLLTFQKKFMKHLVLHRLNTTTYVKDPTDAMETVSVVDNHSRFNLDKAVKEGNNLKENKWELGKQRRCKTLPA